jgi:hypothetical protein
MLDADDADSTDSADETAARRTDERPRHLWLSCASPLGLRSQAGNLWNSAQDAIGGFPRSFPRSLSRLVEREAILAHGSHPAVSGRFRKHSR